MSDLSDCASDWRGLGRWARNPRQVVGNVGAATLDPLTADTLADVRAVYDELIHPQVHDRW